MKTHRWIKGWNHNPISLKCYWLKITHVVYNQFDFIIKRKFWMVVLQVVIKYA
jgi:hypothetical protein